MFTLNCKGRLLVVDNPLVMGIINVTPDSFYENSRFSNIHEIVQQAGAMLQEGAAIIDIGGQSSRPNSEPISEAEELERVTGVIESLHFNFPDAILAIDTYRAAVARAAVNAGASMVNDISGGNLDAAMLPTVAALQVPYICMHMKGTPQTMQQQAQYEDVTREVLDFFIARVAACRQAGIKDVIIDPGFGFGKTIQHNFTLLNNLSLFKMLDCPILLGVSRKSTIYKTLGITPEDALNGTTVLNTIGLLNGADILRVHDVRAAREAVLLMEALKQEVRGSK